MSYQEVRSPRIYINLLDMLSTRGYITNLNPIFRTLPVSPTPYATAIVNTIPNILTDNAFVAILGHQLGSNETGFDVDGWEISSVENIVNSEVEGGGILPEYDGFSITAFDGTGMESLKLEMGAWTLNLGSIIFGTFHDLAPHSPDLSLTMTREYGGIKHIETKGGNTLSNANWIAQPLWGDLPPWELDDGSGAIPKELGRSGRRICDLSFSFIKGSDAFGPNQLLQKSLYTIQAPDNLETSDYDSFNFYEDNLLTDENIFSLINKTNGGLNSFLLQTDKSDYALDNFAIARFDQTSFKFTQVANTLYNFRCKIRECW